MGLSSTLEGPSIARKRTRYRPLIRPWDHQADGLKRLWRMGSALLWWDTGTGKTKTVCDYAYARHLQGQVNRVLVVCPLAAVGVWEQGIAEQLPSSSIASRNDWSRLSEVTGAVHELKQQSDQPLWVIVTYEALQNYGKFLSQHFSPDMIVYDESHYLKNYASTRTKRATFLARHAPYVLCLSATPAPNGYIDLYYQVRMVNPTILPPTIKEFRERFCKMGGYMGREIVGYRNVKELARKLARVTIREKKDKLNLPPEVDQIVPVTLDSRAQRVYDTMRKEMVVTLEGQDTLVNNALTMQLRLGQIAGGFLDGKPVGEQAKLKVLNSLIESLGGQKVIVWALFRDEIKAITKLLDRLKFSHVAITGDVTGRKRTDAIKDFQTKQQPQVLVCQVAALGVGVTLTAASIAVYYSFDWRADVYEQTRGRIARPGQKHTCHYIHLLAKGTVDEDKYHAVQNKMTTQEALGYFIGRLQHDGIKDVEQVSNL